MRNRAGNFSIGRSWNFSRSASRRRNHASAHPQGTWRALGCLALNDTRLLCCNGGLMVSLRRIKCVPAQLCRIPVRTFPLQSVKVTQMHSSTAGTLQSLCQWSAPQRIVECILSNKEFVWRALKARQNEMQSSMLRRPIAERGLQLPDRGNSRRADVAEGTLFTYFEQG